MSEELYCNFTKCRKPLNANAYITVCSHAFCDEHGKSEFSQKEDKKCPGCQTALVKNYDVVRSNLNPSEQFKSMVLAGLRPEVIMEIASRALSFWSYQQYQEHIQQETIIKNLKENFETLSGTSKTELCLLQTELETMKRRQKELEKNLEEQKLKTDEVNEKLTDKIREARNFQVLCETLKKKQLTSAVLQQNARGTAEPSIPQLGPETMGHCLDQRLAQSYQDHRMGNCLDQRPAQSFQDHRHQNVGSFHDREMTRPKNYASPKRTTTNFEFRPQIDRNDFPSPKVFIEGGFGGLKK